MDNQEDAEDFCSLVARWLDTNRIANIDSIDARWAESDAHTGVSVRVTGPTVPIRPILEGVSSLDDWKMEDITMIGDAEKREYECGEEHYTSSVSFFVADVGEQADSELSSLFV